VYGVHKWFARRPPTLVRALLIASHLPDSESTDTFWNMHSEPGLWLQDAVVYDPFMGGGTSLVESARMGASVFGRDVDPVAVQVVDLELRGLSAEFKAISAAIVKELQTELEHHFAGPDSDWIPLHWFWLLKPVCCHCKSVGLLYKDLILATSTGRRGSVVRDDAIHAFCPTCLQVQGIKLGAKTISCCGQNHSIDTGTFTRGKYFCPSCSKKSSHEELQTGTSEKILIAVEETRVGSHRRIRSATIFDKQLASPSSAAPVVNSDQFDVRLQVKRKDRRPVSAGYGSLRSLFTERQWAVFTSAFSKIRAMPLSEDIERELTLMFTGALQSNNVLCGYARDYGRLAALFSVRGFSFPALTVELNPFHPTAGRGTMRSARSRILERANKSVRRARISSGEVIRASFDLPVAPKNFNVICRPADDLEQQNIAATVCVTDPPYFDYIAYSELSEFFRLWLRKPDLAGTPLLPETDSPVESFATGLGGALKATLTRLQPGAPLVFTYHSSDRNAWDAIGQAFDIADLAVVALWPILADPHMGHHHAEGNCEWDVVVVARREDEVLAVDEQDVPYLPDRWISEIEASEFSVGRGDRESFEHAWWMSKSRFAVLRTQD
jgi:putative DNA methylase